MRPQSRSTAPGSAPTRAERATAGDRPSTATDGPRRSRRWLLRATGSGLAVAVAGCQLRQTGDNGTSGDGASGDATPTTMSPGSTYTILVRNFLTRGDLQAVDALSADATATVTVEVEANYDDREDDVLFSRTVELGPEASRTFEGAFSTDPDGPQYVVQGELEPMVETDDTGIGLTHTGAHLFEAGGFQSPRSDTFLVGVHDGAEGNEFRGYLSLNPGEEMPRRP